MTLSPRALLAIVVAVGLATATIGTWLVIERLDGGSPSAIPACSPAPDPAQYSPTPVPAGQFVSPTLIQNGESGSDSETRISVWSDSNSSYYLYIMDSSEYAQLGWTSNASGSPSHSTWVGPAHNYTWGSGPVTSAAPTVLVGDGNWYVVVYDPGSAPAVVNLVVRACNPPETSPSLFG